MLSTLTPAPGVWLLDVPAPLVLDIEEPLADFTSVAVTLTDSRGDERAGVTATIEDDAVEVTWPSTSVFDEVGLYTLELALTGPGRREAVTPLRFPVETNDGWQSLASTRAEWRDAPDEDLILWELLDAAKEACLSFAPLAEDTPVPPRYRQAQLLQARAVWTFTKTNAEGTLGPDGLTVSTYVYPLDRNIQQLLRPRKGVPVLW